MSRQLTPDEVKQEYIATMGPDLGPVFYALYNEVAWLHVRWREYTELFGTKVERVDLLNRAAGAFIRLVQDSMWEDTLLHLSRITDKPKVGRKATLTIRRLPELILGDATLAADVQVLIGAALQKVEFARNWRNRRIAHTELSLALGEGAKGLDPAGLQDVREALDAVAAVLNRLQVARLATEPIPFGEIVGGLGDPRALLYVILDGVEAEDARRRRLREGRPSEEDRRPRREV